MKLSFVRRWMTMAIHDQSTACHNRLWSRFKGDVMSGRFHGDTELGTLRMASPHERLIYLYTDEKTHVRPHSSHSRSNTFILCPSEPLHLASQIRVSHWSVSHFLFSRHATIFPSALSFVILPMLRCILSELIQGEI